MTYALRALFLEWPDSGATLQVSGEEGVLSEEAQLALYRAAQEALTNGRKHAPGEQLNVRVGFGPDEVTLSATNPVHTERVNHTGRGTAGLRRRAQALGGNAGITQENGEWTLWMIIKRRRGI